MRVYRMICAVFLSTLLVGCASTVGSTAQIEEPTAPPAVDEDAEQPPADAEPETAQVSVDFQCPEGWTQTFDAEQNQMVLRAQNGSTIYFTIWPLEQRTPFDMVFAIWEAMEDDVEEGAPIEPGQPTSAESDGAEATYMISTLTVEGGQRITLMHAAFESNDPRFGILVSGIWPESDNTQMLITFWAVAESIRVRSE